MQTRERARGLVGFFGGPQPESRYAPSLTQHRLGTNIRLITAVTREEGEGTRGGGARGSQVGGGGAKHELHRRWIGGLLYL